MFPQSGDLLRGGGNTINVGVSALHPASPDIERPVGTAVVKALGKQNRVPATTEFYNG